MTDCPMAALRPPAWFDGAPGEVAVTLLEIDLAAGRPGERALMAVLDPAERARAARFVFAADRLRFAAGRYLIRSWVAERRGCLPGAVPVVIDPRGRPVLPGGPYFSLAHAGDRVLCAICVDAPVGVDVEPVAPPPVEIVDAVFTPAEIDHLHATDDAGRARRFFWLWTRKEAAVKTLGDGFLRDPRSLCVLDDAAGSTRPVALRSYAEADYLFALGVAA